MIKIRDKVYLIEKTGDTRSYYCLNDTKENDNDIMIQLSRGKIYLHKYYDATQSIIYFSCRHMHNCTCQLKYLFLYRENFLEFIDEDTKTKSIIEYTDKINNIIVLNCDIIAIVTQENIIKYYLNVASLK